MSSTRRVASVLAIVILLPLFLLGIFVTLLFTACGGFGVLFWAVPILFGVAVMLKRAFCELRGKGSSHDDRGSSASAVSSRAAYRERLSGDASNREESAKMPGFAEAKSIADYIRTSREGGFEDDAIKDQLARAGWEAYVIEFAYSIAGQAYS